MASLSSASEGLVASLEKAASELSWIQHRLEDEFSRSCRKGEINTLQLLTRLNKLWRELPALQEECQRVLAAKQELVDAMKRGLVANTEQLQKLRRRAGIPSDAASDETAAAFLAAVKEHEAALQVQYAEEPYNVDDLNQAFVQSTLA